MSRAAAPYTGQETVAAPGLPLDNATVLEFWRWAFGDLRLNDVRGVFAEWLVARLLGIELTVRQSWAGWDLESPAGVRIEVKASAYLQSWHQRRPSRIVFTGLRAKLWEEDTGLYAPTATYKADLYVFCVQIEQDPTRWNALDLDQWRFYLLPRAAIEANNTATLALSSIQHLAGTSGWTAAEFCQHARAAIAAADPRTVQTSLAVEALDAD